MLRVIFEVFFIAIMSIQVNIKILMAGGDYPALAHLKNVYARYEFFIGEYDPPFLDPGTIF
jgi:hypothetical protein